MRPLIRRSIIAFALTLVVAPTLRAQRQPPPSSPQSTSLITGLVGRPRPVAQQPPAAPAALTPALQLTMAQAASGLTLGGIGAKLRLTPAEPASAGRGTLHMRRALEVETGGGNGGYVLLQQEVGGGAVAVTFRPTVAGQPILVDFAVNITPPNATPVTVRFAGETRQLNYGPQHVTALVVPKDTGWYLVSLELPPAKAYLRLFVYAVELTTLK